MIPADAMLLYDHGKLVNATLEHGVYAKNLCFFKFIISTTIAMVATLPLVLITITTFSS